MKTYFIVVAGGKGIRMGSELPKQFLPIGGTPLIIRTIENIRKAVPDAEIILVLGDSAKEQWKDIAQNTAFADLVVANGGSSRTESVKSGLALVTEDSMVAIHDAVRPFASVDCIKSTLNAAMEHGAAIPVVPMTESIRLKKGALSTAVDRDNYCIVQTPQCFRSEIVMSAYEQLSNSHSDDASVVEASGVKIALTQGNEENIKITTQKDLWIAESILKMQKE